MPKRSVILQDHAVVVDGRRIPLFSGEIHYWRIFRERWRTALQSMKDMGLQGAGVYIPWYDCEIAPGDWDFTGRTAPQRDMVGFLELCAEMDMWVLFRPGPYIYAEVRNLGVPDRAAPYHRLHPEFLKMARGYMEAVTEAARPFMATNGGPIVVWQSDNEIDPSIPYFETQLGLAGEPGIFQQWLATRYDSIGALNEAWGTGYASFDTARAWCRPPVYDDPRERRRWLDLIEWKWDYIDRYAQWVSKVYRELGVDVPLLINMFPGVGEHHWRRMQQAGNFIGLDNYPANEFRAEPSEHRRFIEKVRYNACVSNLPYLAEFESGVWHAHHWYTGAVSGRHYTLACLSALLGGARGWNWYMTVERDCWHDAPIDALGNKRYGLFDHFKGVLDLVKQHDPTTWTPVRNTLVTFSTEHYAYGKPANDDPALNALYDADIDYGFFDLEGPTPPTEALCFYSGHPWLDRKQGERLREWVEAGGNLVCFGNFPRQDSNGAPFDPLGIGGPVGAAWFGKRALLKLGDRELVVTGPLAEWDATDAEPLTAVQCEPLLLEGEQERQLWANETGREFVVGVRKKVGRGTVTALGCDASPELVVALHKWFGVPVPCRSGVSGMQTALFRKPGGVYTVVAVNNGDEEHTVSLILHPSLGIGESATVTVGAKSGTVVDLS